MFPIRIPNRHTTLPVAAVTLALAFAMLTPGSAGIITVTATAGPGLPSLLDSSGSAVPSGNDVQLGFFNSGFNFQSTTNLDAAGQLELLWQPRSTWDLRGGRPILRRPRRQ